MSDLGLVEHKVGYLPARRVEAHLVEEAHLRRTTRSIFYYYTDHITSLYHYAIHLVEEAHLRGTTRGTMRRIVYYYTNYIKSLYFAITLTILHHYIIMPSIS